MALNTCCVSGTVTAETPTGTVSTVHDLPTYITRPEGAPKGLVIFLPDAFGWDFVNCRVLADKIAKGGFLVYLPDFMNGPGVNPQIMETMEKFLAPSGLLYKVSVKPFLMLRALPSMLLWLPKNSGPKVSPKINTFIAACRSDPETKDMKIGATGYCWGGFFAVELTHGPTPLVDAAFTAHPSNLVVPAMIDKVQAPLCIAIGDSDLALSIDKVNQAKEILEKKKDGGHEVHIIPGALHGFGIRANPFAEKQKEASDFATQKVVDWFTKWLA